MSYDEVMKEMRDMRSHFDGGFSVLEKTRIVELYSRILGKTFDQNRLACGDCYRDAFLEIFTFLQKNGTLPEEKHYKLKAGRCLHIFGTSEYLFEVTDTQAEKFLAQFPNAIVDFEVYPEDWEIRTADRKTRATKKKTALAKKAAKKAVLEANNE